jgi:transposase-like protein
MRRRRFENGCCRDRRERILTAAREPDAVASEVAPWGWRHVSQLFHWCQQLCEQSLVPAPSHPVDFTPEPESARVPPAAEREGVIEIALEAILHTERAARLAAEQ